MNANPIVVDPPIGTVLDGRFRLTALAATGGLAQVFRASDAQQPGDVAIKLVHEIYASMPWVRLRFEREALLAARVGRKVGAAARGQGMLGERPWLALDFIEGPTLRERLRRGRPRPAEAAAIAVGLLGRVAALHAEGFVHRDLRPANVILEPTGAVRLIDLHGAVPLGLHGAVPLGLYGDTPIGAEKGAPEEPELPQGHPAYSAPEQWRDEVPADPRADVYAIGAILFEALCGRRPFSGDMPALIEAHEKRPPPRPRAFAPSASEELERVLLRALAKDPEERWPSAAAMRAALEATPEHPILSE